MAAAALFAKRLKTKAQKPRTQAASNHSKFLHEFCAHIFLTYLQSIVFSKAFSTERVTFTSAVRNTGSPLQIYQSLRNCGIANARNAVTNVPAKCLHHFIQTAPLSLQVRAAEVTARTGEAGGWHNHFFYQVICFSVFSPTVNRPRPSCSWSHPLHQWFSSELAFR